LFFSCGGESIASAFFYQKRKIPIYCVKREEKTIALSFDAAWGSDKTERILQILRENDVTATFFLVGMWVDKNEDLVKKIDEEGLCIGTHSNTHPDFTKLSTTQMQNELSISIKKIQNITGKKVTLFRAPYGGYNNAVMSVAESLDLQVIQWDVDSLDWKGISGEKISSNILTKVKNGSIILCHNNADHILDALPSVISTLKMRGYTFSRIDDIIFKDGYTIDNTGMQIKN